VGTLEDDGPHTACRDAVLEVSPNGASKYDSLDIAADALLHSDRSTEPTS